MTTSFKNNNPKDGLKWKPRKGTISMVVNPPMGDINEAGYWLEGGYTRTPEKLISVKNPSSWGDANISFEKDEVEDKPLPDEPVIEEEVEDKPLPDEPIIEEENEQPQEGQ